MHNNLKDSISYSDNGYNYNYKHDYELIYDYSEYDMEIDLLNIYGSTISFYQNMSRDCIIMDKIISKYEKLKSKNEFNQNPNIKELINVINSTIDNYKFDLKQELKDKNKKSKYGFKSGFIIGLTMSAIGAIIAYVYQNNK